MSKSVLPPKGGLHLPITRRSLLQATAILSGAGILSVHGVPVFASEVFDDIKGQWESAKMDWKRQSGATIVLNGVQHPWMDAITPLVPHFTKLTGIEVKVQTQSESEYIASLPVKLGAKSATPDVYMVWALGQAVTAGWLEPLGPMFADPKLTDLAWWDVDDLFPSTRAYQTWADGNQYVVSVTAEAQTLFANKTMLDEKGLALPKTMDELLATAKALKTDDIAGIAMRAKSGDGATWPAGGFVFSYGGAIIGLDGKVAVDQPEAVAAIDMYGKLLREAGPIGSGNYHWMECLNDFMAGAVAMSSDSSNFATDIGNKDKSAVAGQAIYGGMPTAAGKPAKPNIYNWTIGMNPNAANKDAAFLFLLWATSKPTAAMAAAAGLATQRTSAWKTSAFGERFGKQAVSAVLENLNAADADLMKATWFHAKGPQILDAFGIGVNEVVTGAKDAQSAMTAAAEKMRAAIG
ncbi:ABC transporter substrate-binding protein [Kaistia granuli]|uniref:ABC transporter substrate-binding protein n=1 Tax=Kaistia granuli TaxID=363259 RepID=UPI00037F7E52|nr:extracellular solute-binding protein [Kaistia granuli]